VCRGDVSPTLRSAAEELIAEEVLASAVCSAATASTNNDALEELGRITAEALPRLHVTDRQTAGRGRQGNRWQSDTDSLTFSLIVPFEVRSPAGGVVSLAVGVAVAEAVEFVYAPCRLVLKWPNDICMNAASRTGSPAQLHKLGGILIESSASIENRLVVGIGLNLNRSPEIADTASTPPASLADLLGRTVDRRETLVSVVNRVVESLAALDAEMTDVIKQYRSRCVLQGKHLSLKQADRTISGHCGGIADDGALELVVDGVTQRFRSGQVQQIRPRMVSSE